MRMVVGLLKQGQQAPTRGRVRGRAGLFGAFTARRRLGGAMPTQPAKRAQLKLPRLTFGLGLWPFSPPLIRLALPQRRDGAGLNGEDGTTDQVRACK